MDNVNRNHKITIRAKDEDLDALEKIREDNHLSDMTKTIHHVIASYQKLTEENAALKEENRKQITRIRLSSSGADMNAQIMMELLNTLLWQREMPGKGFTSTDAEPHPYIAEAKKVVKDRVTRYKQVKDNKWKGNTVSVPDTPVKNGAEG